MPTLQLIKPVEAYGETLRELNFREPIGKDIRACGFPFKFEATDGDGPNFAHPHAAAIHGLIVRLAAVPASTVDSLCLADFAAAMEIVTGFFGQGTSSETPSIGTTTSRGNGSEILIDSSSLPTRN
jgi:Phage tail assembly chaperone proteins, E, or 41 or 14